MKSHLIALTGALLLALCLLALPAAAAVAPEADASAQVTTPTDTASIRLAHGWHGYCGWGPRRGWWHRHTRRGPTGCTPQRYGNPHQYQHQYRAQQPYPQCFYNRWGRWICRY